MDTGYPTAWQAIRRLFWRNKIKGGLTIVAVLAATLTYTALSRPSYTSEAKLFVRTGRETLNVDSTADQIPAMNLGEVRTHEIYSIAEILGSREILRRVAAEHKAAILQEDEEPGLLDLLKQACTILNEFHLNPFQVHDEQDEAVETLSRNLQIVYSKRSALITATLEAGSPEEAQAILRSLIAYAKEEYLRVNRPLGSKEFFDREEARLTERLKQLEDSLRDFKTRNGIASLDKQRDLHLELLGRLREQLTATEAELVTVSAEVAARADRSRLLPEMVVMEEVDGQANTAIDGMREQVFQLKQQEANLAGVFRQNAPRVRVIRDQLRTVAENLQREESKLRVSRRRNPQREAMDLALQEKQTKLLALEAKQSKLQEQIGAAERRIDELNQHEIRLAEFERNIDVARQNHKRNLLKRAEASEDQALEALQISNINLFQEPTLVRTPSSPNVLLNGGIGGALAVLLALGVMVVGDSPRELQGEVLPPAPLPHRLAAPLPTVAREERSPTPEPVAPAASAEGEQAEEPEMSPHAPVVWRAEDGAEAEVSDDAPSAAQRQNH